MTTQSEQFSRTLAISKGSQVSKSSESELHSISFYENEIPDFLVSELDELYENIHSSASKFHIDGRALNATTYVHRRETGITTILVFNQIGRRVEVINESIKLNEDDIQQFANAIFFRYPNVSFITFNAVQVFIEKLTYPHQCHTCLEDIVLNLPVSPTVYFNSLGKATRQYIGRYSKIAKRDFPSFQFKICPAEDLTDGLIRDVIEFSNARIASKDQISLHNEASTQRLIRLIQLHGFVGIILIDGRVCAGAICSKLGNSYFLHVLAHDPNYDNYRLGTICCYHTICDSIVGGGRKFHFLWGRFDYKFRLLGVQQDLQRVVVYRSRAQLVLNGAYALKVLLRGLGRTAKSWLLEPGRRDWRISRIAVKVDESVRRLVGGSLAK
jgi:hypothetical protein